MRDAAAVCECGEAERRIAGSDAVERCKVPNLISAPRNLAPRDKTCHHVRAIQLPNQFITWTQASKQGADIELLFQPQIQLTFLRPSEK